LNILRKTVAIIVAHPDDEILWPGGTILSHPSWNCFVVCLSRKSDINRSPKFQESLKIINSEGIMGDLDDGPEQTPLDEYLIENTILDLLPDKHFDLVITHNPGGEYTRHIRHEETGKAVIKLWHNSKISAQELYVFAFKDNGMIYFPKPIEDAAVYHRLTKRIWQRKYSIITETYGFEKKSWEAETTPKAESFWQFNDPVEAKKWMRNGMFYTKK